jgi:hypothetical protein
VIPRPAAPDDAKVAGFQKPSESSDPDRHEEERRRERWPLLLLAEGHLTRRLFGAIVQRLATLSVPAG